MGESSRSSSERYNEHIEDNDKAAKDSHMFKHWQNQHGGRRTSFKFKVLGFYKTALERQVAEAVRIERTGATKIMIKKQSAKDYSSDGA